MKAIFLMASLLIAVAVQAQQIDPYLLNGYWSLTDSCTTPSEYLALNYRGHYTRYAVTCQGTAVTINSGECGYSEKKQSLIYTNYYRYFNRKWTEIISGDTLPADSIIELTETKLVVYSPGRNKEYLKVKKIPADLAELLKPGSRKPGHIDSIVVMHGMTVPKVDLLVHGGRINRIYPVTSLHAVELILKDSATSGGSISTRTHARFIVKSGNSLWVRLDSTITTVQADAMKYTIKKETGPLTPDSLRYIHIPESAVDYLVLQPKKHKVYNTVARVLYYGGIVYFSGFALAYLENPSRFSKAEMRKHYIIPSAISGVGVIGIILTHPSGYYILK